MKTSASGDGRFQGKVAATRYAGLPVGKDIFLAIGETDQQVQIVKLGKSECLKPSESDLKMTRMTELLEQQKKKKERE